MRMVWALQVEEAIPGDALPKTRVVVAHNREFEPRRVTRGQLG